MSRHVLPKTPIEPEHPGDRYREKESAEDLNPNMREMKAVRRLAVRARRLRSYLCDTENRPRHSVEEDGNPDPLEPAEAPYYSLILRGFALLWRWTTKLFEKRDAGLRVRHDVADKQKEQADERKVLVHVLQRQEILGPAVRDDAEDGENAEDDGREDDAHNLALFYGAGIVEEVAEDDNEGDSDGEAGAGERDPGYQVLEG